MLTPSPWHQHSPLIPQVSQRTVSVVLLIKYRLNFHIHKTWTHCAPKRGQKDSVILLYIENIIHASGILSFLWQTHAHATNRLFLYATPSHNKMLLKTCLYFLGAFSPFLPLWNVFSFSENVRIAMATEKKCWRYSPEQHVYTLHKRKRQPNKRIPCKDDECPKTSIQRVCQTVSKYVCNEM